MEKSIIKVKNLNFKYRNSAILKDINLEIKQGEFVVIIGPRGEGKSTFLKVLSGLISFEEGDIFYDKTNLRTADKYELLAVQRRTAFVFQDSALISNMKIFDNIALPLRYNELHSEEEIEKIINENLNKVELLNEKSILPAFISTGQRKLVALVRAIVVDPETIFYDEPMSNLDKPSQRIIKKIIKETIPKKITSVVVTHKFKAFDGFTDRVIVLKDRTIYKIGTYDEILNSKDEYINSLVQ